jgi:ribosome biogenesis GTPase
MYINLMKYGFNDELAAIASKYSGFVPARVLAQQLRRYKLVFEDGIRIGQVAGKYMYLATDAIDYPTVGDWVMCKISNDSYAVIDTMLPRKGTFLRKMPGTSINSAEIQVISANIDILFICMSLNADFNLNRLERYLAAAWDGGAKPVIVLTKADLCENIQDKIAETESIAFGADIITCSSIKNNGLELIVKYLLPAQTIAFTGSSGVGKSTLINKLLGENALKTSVIRQDDDKGKHTTTHREMFMLPCGTLVIDTPGMRELGIIQTDLTYASFEIGEFASDCQYSNCTHTSESGCAVIAAVQSGKLSRGRLNNYIKLKNEAEQTKLKKRKNKKV